MRLFRAALIVGLTWATTAGAQDVAGLKSEVGALASPPTSAELTDLATSKPNAYVYYVQSFLKDQGKFAGALNGQLNGSTIRALLRFCRDSGIAEACGKGPLEPAAVAATSAAIVEVLTPAVAEAPPAPAEAPATPVAEAPTAEPAAPTEPAVVAEAPSPVEPATLPEGWKISGTQDLGVVATVLEAGATDATIRFSGTATQNGYVNVEFGLSREADAATWKTAISVAQETVAGKASVRLRTGMFNAKGYVGELFTGVDVPADTAPQPLTAGGTPTAEVLTVKPYVQVWAEQGDVVDLTLKLADPQFTKAN